MMPKQQPQASSSAVPASMPCTDHFRLSALFLSLSLSEIPCVAQPLRQLASCNIARRSALDCPTDPAARFWPSTVTTFVRPPCSFLSFFFCLCFFVIIGRDSIASSFPSACALSLTHLYATHEAQFISHLHKQCSRLFLFDRMQARHELVEEEFEIRWNRVF